MQLYVIRHAIAEDAAPGQDDASRRLTEAGERKFRAVVKGLRAIGWTFDRVLTSPWLRAKRTAELLEPVSEEAPIETELLTESPGRELLALLAEKAAASLAVVGHEPWLSELVAWLAFGDPRHGEALDLKKGGIVWLEGSSVPGGMAIRALLPPKFMRELR